MTYTARTAGMTLASARIVVKGGAAAGWSADQLARARAVTGNWARIRAKQAAK